MDRAASYLQSMWLDTHIMMFSEFGRSIEPNQANGTDHGEAGLALLMGGRVNGGQIHGRWPGIDRHRKTLETTTDSRAFFKALLTGIWGINHDELARIFPNSQSIFSLQGLYQ